VSTTIRGISKGELEKKISQAHRAMRDAIGALPAQRWDEKLPSGWTLKEMVGHLAYWESTIPAFVAALRSGTPSDGGEEADAPNARAAAVARGLSRDEVLCRWDDAHTEMLDIARNLSDAELEDASLMQKFEEDTHGHYPNHYADLSAASRTWTTPRAGADLVDPLPSGDRRDRPSEPGREDIDRLDVQGPGSPCGGVEDRTASRLATFRESGGNAAPGIDDTDEFNAAVVERTRGRNAREVLGELDAAHARIVGEIGKLTPSDPPQRRLGHRGRRRQHVRPLRDHLDEIFASVPSGRMRFLGKMREGWRPFRRAVNRLGLSALSDTTPSGWTYKAMLSHVANWMEKLAGEMPNRLAGRRGPFPDVDAEKRTRGRGEHVAIGARRRREAARGIQGSRRSRDRVAGGARHRLPRMRLVVGETYGHFIEHGAEIEASPPADRGRVRRPDRRRSGSRSARPVRERGRAGLGEPTSRLDVQDLVAHVVRLDGADHWRDADERGHHRLDATTIQEFNDRSVRTHELVDRRRWSTSSIRCIGG